MTLSRPRPIEHLPIQRIRSWYRNRPIHNKCMMGYSVMGLRDRAATTKCLLAWNCAGVRIGPPTSLGTGSLAPVRRSSWSPASFVSSFLHLVQHCNVRMLGSTRAWERHVLYTVGCDKPQGIDGFRVRKPAECSTEATVLRTAYCVLKISSFVAAV